MLALLAVALVTATVLVLEGMLHRSALERQRTAVTDRLAVISAKLEGRLSVGPNLSRFLAAVVSTQPEIDEAELTALSTTLMAGNPLIRSLAIARGSTLVFIHPRAGNESALGMNYMANPA
ncbi:MAG: hypothetical protein ACT7A5_28440, partial [Ferrovibrionaceae bacterium]